MTLAGQTLTALLLSVGSNDHEAGEEHVLVPAEDVSLPIVWVPTDTLAVAPNPEASLGSDPGSTQG